MRVRQLVGEQADPALQPRPEPGDEAKDLVAAGAVPRECGGKAVDGDRCYELPRGGSAVGQRRGAECRLNNHALGS